MDSRFRGASFGDTCRDAIHETNCAGAELLEGPAPAIEVVIVYPERGDYITREQPAWYRQAK